MTTEQNIFTYWACKAESIPQLKARQRFQVAGERRLSRPRADKQEVPESFSAEVGMTVPSRSIRRPSWAVKFELLWSMEVGLGFGPVTRSLSTFSGFQALPSLLPSHHTYILSLAHNQTQLATSSGEFPLFCHSAYYNSLMLNLCFIFLSCSTYTSPALRCSSEHQLSTDHLPDCGGIQVKPPK